MRRTLSDRGRRTGASVAFLGGGSAMAMRVRQPFSEKPATPGAFRRRDRHFSTPFGSPSLAERGRGVPFSLGSVVFETGFVRFPARGDRSPRAPPPGRFWTGRSRRRARPRLYTLIGKAGGNAPGGNSTTRPPARRRSPGRNCMAPSRHPLGEKAAALRCGATQLRPGASYVAILVARFMAAVAELGSLAAV